MRVVIKKFIVEIGKSLTCLFIRQPGRKIPTMANVKRPDRASKKPSRETLECKVKDIARERSLSRLSRLPNSLNSCHPRVGPLSSATTPARPTRTINLKLVHCRGFDASNCVKNVYMFLNNDGLPCNDPNNQLLFQWFRSGVRRPARWNVLRPERRERFKSPPVPEAPSYLQAQNIQCKLLYNNNYKGCPCARGHLPREEDGSTIVHGHRIKNGHYALFFYQDRRTGPVATTALNSSREADYLDMIAYLRDACAKVPGVIHCSTGLTQGWRCAHSTPAQIQALCHCESYSNPEENFRDVIRIHKFTLCKQKRQNRSRPSERTNIEVCVEHNVRQSENRYNGVECDDHISLFHFFPSSGRIV